MSFPMKVTRPELAGATPQTGLTSVVLPSPFGPISPSTSPLLMQSVTSRSACKPLKRLDTASRRRISDMLRLPPQHAPTQRNQAARQEQQQHDDQHAEHAAVDLDVVAPDHLLEPEIKKGAADHAERRSQSAHQRHHDRFYRVEDVEHVGGIDVMDPGGIEAAGGADEAGRQPE